MRSLRCRSPRPAPALLVFQTSSWLLATLLTTLMSGCASPGPPRAPSLHLPEVPSDLVAERVGDEVHLRWTTSSKTTDDLGMAGTITAQIYRDLVSPPGNLAAGCSAVLRLPMVPGASTATDRLPPPAEGNATLLAYRVELRNSKERSAGLSSPVYVAGGIAPPAVAQLQAKATREGALLLWQPQDAADTVELQRTQVSLAHAANKAQHDAPPMRFVAVRSDAPATPFVPDAGGMVDITARRGESYTYTAQRVRHVIVAGHALELRSAASAPITIAMRDTFAPQPPDGLEAVATTIGEALAVDLSWKPNTEDDLAGYLVYRREATGTTAALTPSPVTQSAFRDLTAIAGHTYRYTVVAVDTAGNRSVPSAPATEELPLP